MIEAVQYTTSSDKPLTNSVNGLEMFWDWEQQKALVYCCYAHDTEACPCAIDASQLLLAQHMYIRPSFEETSWQARMFMDVDMDQARLFYSLEHIHQILKHALWYGFEFEFEYAKADGHRTLVRFALSRIPEKPALQRHIISKEKAMKRIQSRKEELQRQMEIIDALQMLEDIKAVEKSL